MWTPLLKGAKHNFCNISSLTKNAHFFILSIENRSVKNDFGRKKIWGFDGAHTTILGQRWLLKMTIFPPWWPFLKLIQNFCHWARTPWVVSKMPKTFFGASPSVRFYSLREIYFIERDPNFVPLFLSYEGKLSHFNGTLYLVMV